ncbi:MAG: hypothetical protein J6B37_04930 [Clostridia bacterium]|nr:hypothetical protein [Clostridia bacterium]
MESYERSSNEQYYLPIEFTSNMSFSTHIFHILVIVVSLILAMYFSFYQSINIIIFTVLCGICCVYTLTQWIFYGVLKLGKIEIDDRELYFRTLTCKKRVIWEKVNEMGTKTISGSYGAKTNTFSIGLNEEVDELPFFRKILAKLFNVRGIQYSIPMQYFPQINRISLMRTVNGIMETRYPVTEETDKDDYEEDVYPEDEI